MKTDFVYHIPTKVYFGEGKLNYLAKELEKFGENVLLVYGKESIKKIGLYEKIITELKYGNFNINEISGIEPNPRHTSVNEGVEICKAKKIDVVLAAGGGSVIDAAKLMALGNFL